MARAKRGDRARRRGAEAGLGTGTPTTGEPVRIPGWLPMVLYGLLTLWLFRAFVFTDQMLFGSDTLSLGYVARKFYADVLASGSFPRWNPHILGGTPFLESLAGGDALYPTSLLLLVMEPYRALGWKLVLHVFLAGLFMFGWVRTLGASRAAALLAGVAYGLAPFLVSFVQPGHDGKLFVTALAPLMFLVAERTLTSGSYLPYAGVALTVGLVLFTTHFQMAYFLFGGVGAYYVFRVVQVWRATPAGEGRARVPAAVAPAGRRAAVTRLGLFLAAAVAGAAAAAVQLVPAVDYVLEHSRRTATTVRADLEDNVAWASSWSLHPEEVVSYVVPEFAGNAAGGAAWADDTYWGRNVFKDNHEYAGLIVLLLAGLSFLGAPRKGLRIFLAALGGAALLFALGRHTPVWWLAYEALPGVRLFRAPSQASFLFGFAAITLAAFGVDRVLEVARGGEGEGTTRVLRYLWIAAGALGALMLLAASGALLSFWTAVLHQPEGFQAAALERGRPFIVRGFLFAALLAAAAAAVVWAGSRGLLRPSGVVAGLGLLLAVDALRVDAAFIETFPYHAWAAPDANAEFLMARQREDPPFRVASLVRGAQDVRLAMFGLELATGHHPNDLAHYRELIGMVGSGFPENLLLSTNVARVLNVRYLIVPAELGEVQGLPAVSATQLGGQPWETVYEFPGLPRARLVAEAEVSDGEAAVARIMDPEFDPERVAVLAEAPPVRLPGGEAAGQVTWEERTPNRQRLRVVSEGPALLVLADNWFPSWHARVDGLETPVLRAYHTLRAIPVGPGTQTVELYYRSPLVRASLAVSLVTLVLLLGAGAVSLARSRGRGAAEAGA